jgi:glycosyltransferase involved in cell wall biosynthesis
VKDDVRRKPDKIRVGFICDQLEIGGQEKACHRLLQHLDRTRFAPYLFAFRPGQMLDEFYALDIPVYLGHFRPAIDTTWNDTDRRARIAWRKRLTQLLQHERIDIVVVFSWRDGPGAARAAGVRAIVERVDGPALADRICDKSGITRVVCESRSVGRLLLSQRKRFGLTREQVTVLENSIDRTQFNPARFSRERCRMALGIAKDEFIIGTIARLVPAKNIGNMIRAIALLSRLNMNVRQSKLRLFVVGPDRGERRALLVLARELGIVKMVTFLGPRTDIPEILRALDIFVSTSIVEGTPNALLEAMAMALPVIATPVGGVPDLLDARHLVSPRAYRLLAKELLKLWQEPLLRKQLGRQNRQKSAQFDITDAARHFEELLIKAIHAGQRGPALARRLLFISPANGKSNLLRPLADQLKKEKVYIKFVKLHDHEKGHLMLQKLRRTSDPDLVLVQDIEIANFVRHELKYIEIVFLQQDDKQLPRSPKKYAAVDHVLLCSEASVAAVQNAFPYLADKIVPGHLELGKKNVAIKLVVLLERQRNHRHSEEA